MRSSGNIAADRVVVAAGNGTAELLRTAGYELPMVDQRDGGAAWGFLAEVHAPAHGLERLVTTDHVNLRPVGTDHLLVQALELDHDAGRGAEVTPALEREYLDRVSALLGRIDLEVTGIRVGHRVIPADGMTVAGPIDGNPESGLWTVVTHSGITLAPYLAETVADEICQGRQRPTLEGFRPTRFAAGDPVSSGYSAPMVPGEQ
ncbi:MAG: NAD(P)/FAD-dependent oxidoreductase [Brachybacterium tyrofermentans]|uniref:NAD(P)/FAD-dependent oxidoreductase n=1 Tax=Brachybacterium tyrofermentans TaxID=47848 RepID=UPI001866135D